MSQGRRKGHSMSTGDCIVPGYIEDARSDPMYGDAIRAVAETNRASIATVQRVLKIGYNRAARMIETMEAEGLVSPPGYKGDRQVLPVLRERAAQRQEQEGGSHG